MCPVGRDGAGKRRPTHALCLRGRVELSPAARSEPSQQVHGAGEDDGTEQIRQQGAAQRGMADPGASRSVSEIWNVMPMITDKEAKSR